MRALLSVSLLFLVACTRDAPPTFVGSSGGSTPPARITPQSLIIWRDSQVATTARPVFDSSNVYFLGTHNAFAVSKTTGALLWNTALTYPAGVSSPQGYGTAVAAGRVIMGDIDVFGLDPSSGAIVWRFAPRTTFPNERSFDRLTTDGTTVYCGGVWGNVYAVDAASGTENWVSHVTTLPDSFVRVFNPVIVNGVVYVAFSDDQPSNHVATSAGGVAAMDAVTGRLLWSTYLPNLYSDPNTDAEEVAVTATEVITATAEGFLYGLDRQTGAVLDTVPQATFGVATGSENGGIFNLAAVDTVVAVSLGNGVFLALDARNLHRQLWTATLNYGGVSDMTADSSRVYTSYAGGQFGVTNLATGKVIWWIGFSELRPSANYEYIASAATVDGTRIYVGSNDAVYAFKWQ